MRSRAITTSKKNENTMSIADIWLKSSSFGVPADALNSVGAAIAIAIKAFSIVLCFCVCNVVCSFLIPKNSFF